MSAEQKQERASSLPRTEGDTKQKPPGRRLTRAAVETALRKTHGQISLAARILGVRRQAVHEAVNRFGLQDFVRELRDEVTDEVELKLMEAALAGRPWAVQFWLRTIGRDRGYVERQEVAQVGKLEVELVEVPHDGG